MVLEAQKVKCKDLIFPSYITAESFSLDVFMLHCYSHV